MRVYWVGLGSNNIGLIMTILFIFIILLLIFGIAALFFGVFKIAMLGFVSFTLAVVIILISKNKFKKENINEK